MGLWSSRARSPGAHPQLNRASEGKPTPLGAKVVQRSKAPLASLAEPDLLQTDHHAVQTLHLFHLLQHLPEGQLPAHPSNSRGDILPDSPHHRLLRACILRQHLPVQARLEIMAFQRGRLVHRSEYIPLLHRGRQHDHERPRHHHPSAGAVQDEGHPTRSHRTHRPDPSGYDVSAVRPEVMVRAQAANPPQPHGLHNCEAGNHGISRIRHQDGPAMHVPSPLLHFVFTY